MCFLFSHTRTTFFSWQSAPTNANDDDSWTSPIHDVESRGSRRNLSQKQQQHSKKKGRGGDYDDSSDEDSASRRKPRRRGDSEDSEDSQSRRQSKARRKNSKSRYDSDSSHDDDDDEESRRRPKRQGSKKRLDDSDDDSGSESRRSRRGKVSRGSSKRRLDHSDSEEEESRYSRPSSRRGPAAPRTVEESVRQARSILKTVKKNERNEEGVTVEVQQVMNAELSEMIATLKRQKDEAEQRLRNSETEATKLRIEKEASARQIAELETLNMKSKHHLLMTQHEAHQLHAHNTLTVAESEAETIRMAAELEQVQREREAMSKMIEKLEKARSSMKSKLNEVQDEAYILREENAMAMHHVKVAHNERLEMQEKLASIQNARADIERRLLQAELDSKNLQALKKAKTHDIRVERSSTHVRTSYLNEMEAERKAISADLTAMEEERAQMHDMLAKLDASRQQIAILLEGDEGEEVDGEGEESMPLGGLSDTRRNSYQPASRQPISTSGNGRFQPSLSTIQSPLMGSKESANQRFNDIGNRSYNEDLGGNRNFFNNDMGHRSFNNDLVRPPPAQMMMMPQSNDPSYQIQMESAILRDKRRNARRSERKLRQTMEMSRSSRSLGSVGSLDDGTGLGGGSYHSNTQW